VAKEKSEKTPFWSKYGAEWITPAAYLAEEICGRKAWALDKKTLPSKFWNESEYWRKEFQAQITHAARLLVEYGVEDIVKALKHPDLKRVYSFGLKSKFVPILEEITKEKHVMKIFNIEHSIPPEGEPPAKIQRGPRKAFCPSNKKNLLKALEETSGEK
jgi:hypothetical protein